MKILALLCLLVPTFAFAENTPGRYEAFIRLAELRRKQTREEGISYVIGGGLGLGLSVGLGISSEETVPKLGYSLIQVLSAAAIGHGASLYYHGDSLTVEADRLSGYAAQLAAIKGISEEQRKKLLDEATNQALRAETQRYQRMRKIRGYLELTSAVAGGATIALSKSSGSASNAALGFIVLISLVGAYSDLTGSDTPSTVKELYSIGVDPGPRESRVWVSWRW